MTTYGEVEIKLHACLTSTVDGGKWSDSSLSLITTEEGPCVPVG